MNSNKKKDNRLFDDSSSDEVMEEVDNMDGVDVSVCIQVLYKHEKRTTKDTFD